MIKITGKEDNHLTVTKDTILTGMVANDVTVKNAVELHVRGMVTGDLTAEKGSTVIINGMVNGTVFNKGAHIKSFGTVDKVVDEDPNQISQLHPSALVKADIYRGEG